MASKGPTRDQFTDEEWRSLGKLFDYLAQLQREGVIGRKAA